MIDWHVQAALDYTKGHEASDQDRRVVPRSMMSDVLHGRSVTPVSHHTTMDTMTDTLACATPKSTPHSLA